VEAIVVRLVVYSTIFGRTDPLHEPRNPGTTRFVMFTDRPMKSRHWEIVQVPPSDRPKRECRKLKQPSHWAFPEAEATLWVDAAFEFLADPLDILDRFQGEMTAFRHHKRTRIVQEAPAIIAAGKGLADGIYAQLAAYQADGWDTDENPQRHISNGGFLLRRHTDRVKRFNELWHHEVQTRTLRDQMSIDYCAAKAGLRIDHFPGIVPRNEFVRRHPSRNPTNDF
jgi:hypothetical protein